MNPYVMAGSAALGGLAGALSHKGAPAFVTPNFHGSFNVNGVGKSTGDGFTADRSLGFMNALRGAEGSLNPLLQKILNSNSTGNAEKFQNAFVNARRPQLDRALAQRTDRLNSNISGQGLSGSSASLLAQYQNARSNNEQIQQLLNQGIIGGQALQQQDLQNNLNKFGLANNFSQQNFGNTLQSALGLGGLLNQNNQMEINKANALNGIAQARNASSGNMLSSILSGVQGGLSIGSGLSGMFGGSGGKGGAGGFDFSSLFGSNGNQPPSNMYQWLPQ